MTTAARAGIAVACLLGGAVMGVASVVTHGLDLGLALGIAATAAVAYALPGGWSTRAAYALGWLIPVGIASDTRPEGDYLVASNGRGYLLLLSGLALVLFALWTIRPAPGGRRRSRDRDATDVGTVDPPP